MMKAIDEKQPCADERSLTGLQEAMADVKAGRVYHAASGEDLIRLCLD